MNEIKIITGQENIQDTQMNTILADCLKQILTFPLKCTVTQ